MPRLQSSSLLRTSNIRRGLLGALLGLSSGCNVKAALPSAAPAETTVFNAAGSDAGDAALDLDAGPAEAAAAGGASGSPLCTAPEAPPTASCDPDVPISAWMCDKAPDGGPYDLNGGYADAGLACRVVPVPSGASSQGTSCDVAGPSADGAECGSSADCAPGYDCVGSGAVLAGDGGVRGTCRHYCCAGNSQCPTSEFCDVQPLAQASTTPVPVCMPIDPCGASGLAGQVDQDLPVCPAGQTCTVVREDGATGCVEIGPVTALGSCSASHCGAGLACLGPASDRVCYTLCSTNSPGDCVAPATCQGGLPLFQNPMVGVCR